jgi:hypothetical protein
MRLVPRIALRSTAEILARRATNRGLAVLQILTAIFRLP